MWAMLLAIWRFNQSHGNRIKTIACPGLGTGVGQVKFQDAARMMSLAWMNFQNPPQMLSWPYADARHNAIRYGGDESMSLVGSFY